MKWTFRAGLLASAVALSACGFGAPSYPTFGETAYRIEGVATANPGAAPIQTVIYRDGPKMRVETTLPNRGPATIVFDEATDAAFVLSALAATPAAPAAAPQGAAPATPAAPAANGATPAPAAPAAANVGVAVRVADTEAPQPLEAPWAALGADGAESSGACNVAGESGQFWTPRADTAGVARTACITEDGIVLEVRQGDHVLFQATSLQRGAQDAALFGVPPGYQIVDPLAVVESVGETMEQLDSVAGAPTSPPAPRPTTGATPAPTP